MNNASFDYYNSKLPEIEAINEDQLIHIPMPVNHILQEAEDLYHTCSNDKELLINKSAVDESLIEDLNARAGALRYIQGEWNQGVEHLQESLKEWANVSPEAFRFRDELSHHFLYAYRNLPDVLEALRNIMDGSSNDDMIQDLTDLSIMGKSNPEPLEVIHFDMTLLDKAAKMSDDLADLLAKVNGVRESNSPIKILRDKAYLYLKQAMDEIRKAGQYIFWHNKNQRKLYASKYMRRKISKQREKSDVVEVPLENNDSGSEEVT